MSNLVNKDSTSFTNLTMPLAGTTINRTLAKNDISFNLALQTLGLHMASKQVLKPRSTFSLIFSKILNHNLKEFLQKFEIL